MTEHAARVLAEAIGGEAHGNGTHFEVSFERPDGWMSWIDTNSGHCYLFDRPEAGPNDRPRELTWGHWWSSREWATGLATLIGAEAHQSGGYVWVVRYQRPDGRFLVIGEDCVCLYRDRWHYDNLNDDEACDYVYYEA